MDAEKNPAESRLRTLYLLFALFVAGSALGNQLLDRIDVPNQAWAYNKIVPPFPPLGADLRVFIEGSDKMYHGENPFDINYAYPPLVAVVFYPFIPMSYGTAYRVMFFLNTACNLAGLLVLARLASRAFAPLLPREDGAERWRELAMFSALLITGLNQFFGYPFEFSLERANYDSFALVAILAGLWFSAHRPGRVWLPVLAFSLAAHLKVYPGLLLLLPVWQHGRRALLPILAVNTGMLFCFGFERGLGFLNGIYFYSKHPYLWEGNHSAVSFSTLVIEPRLAAVLPAFLRHAVSMALLLVPALALWAYGSWKLYRKGYSERTALLATALSTPVMCVLPSVSHDYKLIILIVPAFLCVMHLTRAYLDTGRRALLLGLATTLYCLLTLGRSVLQPPLMFTDNKYPAVLILEAVTFWMVWRELAPDETTGEANQG